MPCARPRGKKWQQLAVLALQSGASAILTSVAVARFIPRQEIADIPVLVTDGEDNAARSVVQRCADWHWVRPSIAGDDIAFIQYTSGSTSNPKGVVITHGNVMSNLASISRAFSCSSSDVGLSWLPLHHDMGLIGHVLQPVYAGVHNYFMSAVDFLADPSRWLAAISRFRVTISGGPGFAYGYSVRQQLQVSQALDLTCWRLAYCGSDRLSPETLEKFASRYSFYGFSRSAWFSCYGLAESTLYVCGIRAIEFSQESPAGENHVCVGMLDDTGSDATIRIMNPDSRQICADGAIGEIWLSSPSVSPGYYRQSILSRQSFNQLVDGVPEYFRTGDLGFVRDGKLYFSGRLKNLIKIRGRTLHAEDIESLLQHETADTGLQRCVAVGVQVDEVDSFVILAEHRSRRSAQPVREQKQLERQLRNLVCDTFGVVPHAVMIVPSATLPLTSSGKPVRALCQKVYRDRAGVSVCSRSTLQQEVTADV